MILFSELYMGDKCTGRTKRERKATATKQNKNKEEEKKNDVCWFWGCKQYYLPFLSFLFSPFHSGRARASLSRSRPFRGQRVKFKVRMVAPETTMHLHTLHSDRTVFFRCTTVYPPCRFLQPGIIAYDLPSLPPLHAVWHALLTSGLCSLESQLDVRFIVLWF